MFDGSGLVELTRSVKKLSFLFEILSSHLNLKTLTPFIGFSDSLIKVWWQGIEN